jgi:hypothetical protein
MSKIKSLVLAILAQLAVDPAPDRQVSGIDLVGGHDPRPHRAEPVERLAEEPLLVLGLKVAGGDVVRDGIAPHVPVRIRAFDAAAAGADDHRQFGFVVHVLGDPGVTWDGLVGRDHGARRLGENDRSIGHRGRSAFCAAVVTALGELPGVLGIIFADAQDVARRTGDRRAQGDLTERDAVVRGL